MRELHWRKLFQTFVLLLALAPIALFFQNCGEGFSSRNDGSLSSNTNPDGTTNPPPPPVDPNAPLQIFARDTSVQQGAEMVFRIESNRTHTEPIVVNLQTTDGTALAPNDYDTFTGSVTIPVGQTFAEAKIQSRAFTPASIEKQMQMQLQIMNTSAGTIGDNAAVGTIRGTVRAMKFKDMYANISGNFGETYNCGVGLDDFVYCWGDPNFARTGITTRPADFTKPTMVTTVGSVRNLASSHVHSCAINTQNKVFCWGYYKDSDARRTPAEILEFAGATDIATSGALINDSLTCAVKSDGSVQCFDYYNTISYNIPFPTPIKKITIGGQIPSVVICGITLQNDVICVQRSGFGTAPYQFATIDNSALGKFKIIAGGRNGICGITLTDTLACWTGNTLVTTPVFATAKDVAVGDDFRCIIDANDLVQCWGGNTRGTLGQGHTTSIPTTTSVIVPGIERAIRLRATGLPCAITANNDAFCWGNRAPTVSITRPRALVFDKENSPKYRLVSYATRETFGVTLDNQFMIRKETYLTTATYPVLGLSNAKKLLRIGDDGYCFLSDQNDIRCWGTDANNFVVSASSPIILPGANNIKEAYANNSTLIAIDQTDTVYRWTNFTSQPILHLGNSTIKVSKYAENCNGCVFLTTTGDVRRFSAGAPLATGLTGVRSITSDINTNNGVGHWCVLYDSGRVACSGSNTVGQLGNNSTVDSTTLVDVVGLSNVESLFTNSRKNCAVLRTGNVKCWGFGLHGNLGNGRFENALVPVDVLNVTNVRGIDFGASQTRFLLPDGTLRGAGLMDHEALSPNIMGAIPN